MERQVPRDATVWNTGVRAGEKMTLKRLERQLRDLYDLTMVVTEGSPILLDPRKDADGNTLLKMTTRKLVLGKLHTHIPTYHLSELQISFLPNCLCPKIH
jgi:hypothetical protein